MNNNWLFSFGVWLFYIAFIILGVGIGLIVGSLIGAVLISATLGFIIGLGLGMLTHAKLVIKKYFRHQC